MHLEVCTGENAPSPARTPTMPNPRAPSVDLPAGHSNASVRPTLPRKPWPFAAALIPCKRVQWRSLPSNVTTSPMTSVATGHDRCHPSATAAFRCFGYQGLAGLQDRPRPGRAPGFPRATRALWSSPGRPELPAAADCPRHAAEPGRSGPPSGQTTTPRRLPQPPSPSGAPSTRPTSSPIAKRLLAQ